MITCRVDGRNAVDTGWETVGKISAQDTVVCDTVETLEESKNPGIQGLGRVER